MRLWRQLDTSYRNRHKNCARSVVHETSITTEPAVSHSTQRLCWKRDPCDCKDNQNLTYRNRRTDDTALDHNRGIATAIRLTKFNCCQDDNRSLTRWPTQFNEVGHESQRWMIPEDKWCYCFGTTQACASCNDCSDCVETSSGNAHQVLWIPQQW